MATAAERELLVFAALLAEPGEDGLAALAELGRREVWLRPALRELEGVPLPEWQAEHTRLFVSGQPTVCPPFASAYLSGQMHGPVVGRIAALFRAVGLRPAIDLPADYLGMLLEFGAHLLRRGDGAAEHRRLLWQEYLDPWLPRFAADLCAGSCLVLYRELGARLGGLCPAIAVAQRPFA